MRSFILLLFFIFPSHIYAYDLENIATTSATATVPSTIPTTGDTTAPSAPILLRPIDGTIAGDNKPEFVWRRSVDPNGNVVIYTLYINGVASYLGISNLGNSAGTGYTARIDSGEIKLIPTISLLDGNYNWYVTAEDGSGNVSRSTIWNLTIDTTTPHILVTDIDTYHNLLLDSNNPENFVGKFFEISGPKDIYFTIYSESWSTLTLQFYNSSNELVAQSSWPVNNSGIVYPYQHLEPGSYRVTISAFDHGANTTALPDINLIISQAQISVPLPPIPGIPSSYSIPYKPISLSSLPATISNIQTRLSLPYPTYILLAIGIIILLIILWRRKYNLILLNSDFSRLDHVTIYHSNPTLSSSSFIIHTSSDKSYIPHLTRYSTLTIRTDSRTYVLSISLKQRIYTIIL